MKVLPGSGLLLLVLLGGLVQGCAERPVKLDDQGRATLCLPLGEQWVPLHAEWADTQAKREKGLSGRERLPRRQGMLFLYPEVQGADNRFWMYQTRMPLDIAFLDKEGVIRNTFSMRPCLTDDPESCNRHHAGVAHQAVLEVNKGLFEALGVSEGDQLRLGSTGGGGECDDPAPFGPALFNRAQ